MRPPSTLTGKLVIGSDARRSNHRSCPDVESAAVEVTDDRLAHEGPVLEIRILVRADAIDGVEPPADSADNDLVTIDEHADELAFEHLVRGGGPSAHPEYTVNRFVVSR
jgi:hypothetical protein